MRKARTTEKIPFLAQDVLTKVVPAPTDGWDQISPIAEMDPKRAPILTNWVVRPGYVELRGGYVPYLSTLTTAPVESLMAYRGPSGEQFFAAASSHIYNVSTGQQSGTSVVSGLSSARWQYVNFTVPGGGHYIQCVNGADNVQMYDGTTWTAPSITGLPGSGVITNINIQKVRLWYVIKNSTIAAFMPTGAIQGPIAGYLDLGGSWNKGGHLIATGAWTIDGGSGPQDYALFISDRGQVTIYSGIDPTNAANWALVGTFDIAPPIGLRCMLRLGSDVGIITQQGVIPISQALPFDPSVDRSVAITSRIQNYLSQAAMTAETNFGWQLIAYPNQQLILLNIPFTTNSSQSQAVMNTLTGGWSLFTGWNANCFEIYGDNLYFGGNSGQINQAYQGGADYITSIPADLQCAFNWFDEPGKVKRITMVQPLLTLGANITPTLAIDEDFSTSTVTSAVTTFTGGVTWDSAIWDTSLWPALTVNFSNWLSVQAIGHALAIHMNVNVSSVANPSSPASSLGVFDVAQFDVSTFDSSLSTTLPILRVNAFNTIAELGGAI